MRNKFFKGAHLSEKDVKRIFAYFSEDLTATEISAVTGVSRVTINSYLKGIREQICRVNDPGYVNRKRQAIMASEEEEEGPDEVVPPCFFSVKLSGHHVRVLPLDAEGCEAIKTLKKGIPLNGHAAYLSQSLSSFQAFIDPEGWRLIRLDPATLTIKKHRGYVDDIDTFWALAKTRLSKFRGLSRSSVYLHLKESEFRYNHRHENLYDVLCQFLKMHPLGN